MTDAPDSDPQTAAHADTPSAPAASVERRVTVVNTYGLHARPCMLFVEYAARFQSDILVIRDADEANGKSILGLMSLTAEKGAKLLIRATGTDAEAAVTKLEKLINSGFDED